MKIPTKDYSDYQIGDLLIYKEGEIEADMGYIEKNGRNRKFKVRWFKDIHPSEESEYTIQGWSNSYVFPVSKQ